MEKGGLGPLLSFPLLFSIIKNRVSHRHIRVIDISPRHHATAEDVDSGGSERPLYFIGELSSFPCLDGYSTPKRNAWPLGSRELS